MFGGRKEDQQPQDTASSLSVPQQAARSSAAPRPLDVAAAAQQSAVTMRREPAPSLRAKRSFERTGDYSGEPRTLRVGQGLSVAGEIASCDVLVVEGKVEAKLTEGKLLEITESGQFRGSVEIESADIAGRYDGQLTVHGRLIVRGTGRVSGMVKYGELEVTAGGQIIGEMQVIGNTTASALNQPGANFRGASKFASASAAIQSDDEESIDSSSSSQSPSRRSAAG